jgi:HAD superfamily hydrolase (TIGR01509 family)
MSPSPEPPPATVVFDLGNVLLAFDYRIAAANLAPHASASAEEILDVLLGTRLLHRYECGELNTVQFFDALSQATGFTAGFDAFARCFTEIFTPIPPMIELQRRIRAGGVPTVLLSNTNELQFQHLRERHPFIVEFEHHVLSFEHRAMKPDLALYRVVEELTGRVGSDLVFLDDRPDNVEAACRLGWRAFVHENPERSSRHFVDLGLLSSPC